MVQRSLVALLLSLAACALACSTTTAASPSNADAATTDAAADAALTPYPTGPYGLRQGDVFPLLVLKGYRAGVAPFTDIPTSEYYDPDGARGIRAIHLTVQATWCGPCINFEKLRVGLATTAPNSYASKGVRFVTSLVQGVAAASPAGQADLDTWLTRVPESFDLLADPDGADAGPRAQTIWDIDGGSNTGNFAIPLSYTIDPRTMKIGAVDVGFGSAICDGGPVCVSTAAIDAMLAKNR